MTINDWIRRSRNKNRTASNHSRSVEHFLNRLELITSNLNQDISGLFISALEDNIQTIEELDIENPIHKLWISSAASDALAMLKDSSS